MFLVSSADFFSKIDFLQIIFQKHYQSAKRFGNKSVPMFCRSWSGSKLFAKLISRRQKTIFCALVQLCHTT